MFPHTGLPRYCHLQCSRDQPASGQGVICALEVISSRGMGSESIAIYSVPAHRASQVSLFTVFPHTGLPKYCYLQCSCDQPASGHGVICALEVISSRGMGSESIAIYSVPAHWAPQVSLFTCLLYTSPSPRDATLSRMPSSA